MGSHINHPAVAPDPAASDAAAASPPSIAREAIGGVLAALIALGCVLPPLLHLVTGPLGPFIGAFIVAHHLGPGPRGRAIIAVTLGITLAALGAAAARAIVAFGGPGGPPDWFPSGSSLGLILCGVWLYATLLGAAGAALGARGKAAR